MDSDSTSGTSSSESYPRATWRLLKSQPASGAWNMAVDEAILEAIGREDSPSTLRLYAWNPPCLSLGYAQPEEDVDWQQVSLHHWQVVRRPTGGRAILHTDELTYAVIAPHTEPRLSGGVLVSYRRISRALLNALNILNLLVESVADPEVNNPSSNPKGPVCFEVPSNYEITFQGKKLIGSAQARRKEGILQHGTLPISGDLTRITKALHFPGEDLRQEAASRLLERATTVELALGRVISWRQAADAFAAGFSRALNLDFQVGRLSRRESERALELVEHKYQYLDWSDHRSRPDRNQAD